MATMNGVEIGDVVKDALTAAKTVGIGDWSEMKDLVKNIADSLLVDQGKT